MNLLVTGCAGFIGYHLSKKLQNEKKINVIGLDNINAYYDVDLKKPTAIIMGSEECGINPSTLKICDHKAKLPMEGEIASLNVSVACGAFLYETMRQKLSQ